MPPLIKSLHRLRRFLLAAIVSGIATAAGATASQAAGNAADHAGHFSVGIAAQGVAGDWAPMPEKHRGDHTNHCSADAVCQIGAWSLAGHAAGVQPVFAPIVRLIPRNTSLEGLRLRPELRPPRVRG